MDTARARGESDAPLKNFTGRAIRMARFQPRRRDTLESTRAGRSGPVPDGHGSREVGGAGALSPFVEGGIVETAERDGPIYYPLSKGSLRGA